LMVARRLRERKEAEPRRARAGDLRVASTPRNSQASRRRVFRGAWGSWDLWSTPLP
jgi:hypothetical protein